MLSHDNYVWVATEPINSEPDYQERKKTDESVRGISFLPLSHVAAQYVDIFLSLNTQAHMFFADANALKGTLIDYLLEIRPHMFVAVPRVYEKMEEKVRSVLEKKKFVYKWATHVTFC